MKKNILTITALLTVMLFAGVAQASDIATAAADESIALRVYNGGIESVTINIYAGDNATNDITIGSQANTLDFSGAGADTITEIVADIVACTNSAGTAVLTVDSDCALAADSTDDELLDAQVVTIAAGAWGEILWDTTAALHYDVYIPDDKVAGSTRVSKTINSIFGSVTGTGTATASVYIDGDLSWQKVIPETYAYSNNTAAIDLPVDVGVYAGRKAVLVRVSRASSATTGMVGIRFDNQ